MPQAQSKELDADYGRLQQTYSRLSAEHASVTNQHKRNFQLFKEQKANEISSLEGRNVRILTPVLILITEKTSALGITIKN